MRNVHPYTGIRFFLTIVGRASVAIRILSCQSRRTILANWTFLFAKCNPTSAFSKWANEDKPTVVVAVKGICLAKVIWFSRCVGKKGGGGKFTRGNKQSCRYNRLLRSMFRGLQTRQGKIPLFLPVQLASHAVRIGTAICPETTFVFSGRH